MTPQNDSVNELVGLYTSVIESTNSQIIGLSGKIVNETKSMLEIQTRNGLKKIPKNHSKWQVNTDTQKFVIDGASINKRPQDRIGVELK